MLKQFRKRVQSRAEVEYFCFLIPEKRHRGANPIMQSNFQQTSHRIMQSSVYLTDVSQRKHLAKI